MAVKLPPEPEYEIIKDGKKSWFWHRWICFLWEHKHRYPVSDTDLSYCPRCDRHLRRIPPSHQLPFLPPED